MQLFKTLLNLLNNLFKQDPKAIGFVSYVYMSMDVKTLIINGINLSESTIAD